MPGVLLKPLMEYSECRTGGPSYYQRTLATMIGRELRNYYDLSEPIPNPMLELLTQHGVSAPRATQHGLPAREARHGDRSSREHENSKNLLAGSNPSKRHLADSGITVPSDQERKTRPIAAIQIKLGTFRKQPEVRRDASGVWTPSALVAPHRFVGHATPAPRVRADRNTTTI